MRKNYKWRKILTTAVLCPALVLGMAACGQNGGNSGSGAAAAAEENAAAGEPAGEKAEEVVFRPPVDTPFVTPGEKDESVYVKADAAGRPTEKTVEVVLKKIEGSDPIEDRSNLREIKNTEGNEEYTEAGEGGYLWQNNGEDIHYKGKSDEALPVNVRITYYLEGQEVSAEEIAGKTGKVKIRFDYENSTDVPFMVLSAAMLPADVFSDVDVTNGRVMDLGDQKAVIGFAFPGLMDTLKLVDYEPTEKIELPEYVEIEARAEDFALDFTASVVSTGLFEELEDKDLEDLDKLPEDMEELTDASTEIRDAAQELADGGSEFGDYLSQYFDGLSQLSEGTDSLDQGLTLLSQNISKISEGSKSLQEGLSQVDQSLAKVDLSSLSSPESREASEAAQAAFVSLGQSGAELKEKLGGIGTELETIRTFTEDVNTYIGQVQVLQNAVEESPAPDLAAADLENGWTESLNAEASGQAGEKAADVRDSIIEIVESSSFPDDLGLTDEQKMKIINQIVESINENTNGEDTEISLDAAFGEIRDGIQKDAEGNRNTLRDASAQIVEPAVPALEALSPEKMEEIAQITANMEQSLAVIGVPLLYFSPCVSAKV